MGLNWLSRHNPPLPKEGLTQMSFDAYHIPGEITQGKYKTHHPNRLI